MRLYAELLDLPLRATLHIGDYSMRSIQTVITVLLDEANGIAGVGEASVNAASTLTAGEVLRELCGVPEWPDRLPSDERDHSWAPLLAGLSSPARCGIVSAALDLLGKLTDRAVWRMWATRPAPCPATSVTVSQRDPVCLAEELAFVAAVGTPQVKVKLSPFTGHDQERRRLEAIHAALPEASLRVDMNCSWSPRQFREAIGYLGDLGVAQVEEPLGLEFPLSAYDELHAIVPFELIADERTLRHPLTELAGRFHCVNLKQAYLGGPCGVHHAIGQARRCGLRVMLGCNGETSVGISAMAQLAPMADHLDLDSALLLAEDPFRGIAWVHGRPVLRDVPGTGVRLASPDRCPERLSSLLGRME